MFVQVIQAKAEDAEALRGQAQVWDRELKAGAVGYLGTTAGVTVEGEFIALVRFESEEAARANAERAEQGAWWEQTARYLRDPVFHDCAVVDLMGDGGSDEAGFVQVIQAAVTDMERARALDREGEAAMGLLRPDVIGGITAWHEDQASYTSAIYFTSEAEAREKEKEMTSSPEFDKFMSEMQAISAGEPRYFDLLDPFFGSP